MHLFTFISFLDLIITKEPMSLYVMYVSNIPHNQHLDPLNRELTFWWISDGWENFMVRNSDCSFSSAFTFTYVQKNLLSRVGGLQFKL